MSLILYSVPGCYPCDKVKKLLINAKLPFTIAKTSLKDTIKHYPTLCIETNTGLQVAALAGPSKITVENILEILNKYNIALV
jgi:hypothetical protein